MTNDAHAKELLPRGDRIQDILETRTRARHYSGQFQAVPAGLGLVSDITINSCSAVVNAFAADGFFWAKEIKIGECCRHAGANDRTLQAGHFPHQQTDSNMVSEKTLQ